MPCAPGTGPEAADAPDPAANRNVTPLPAAAAGGGGAAANGAALQAAAAAAAAEGAQLAADQEDPHPFETDPGDHAETPFEAYQHLELLLMRLAK